MAALEIDSNALVLSGAREAGCFREVAALHSDHLRQVPLYNLKCVHHSDMHRHYAVKTIYHLAGYKTWRRGSS